MLMWVLGLECVLGAFERGIFRSKELTKSLPS